MGLRGLLTPGEFHIEGVLEGLLDFSPEREIVDEAQERSGSLIETRLNTLHQHGWIGLDGEEITEPEVKQAVAERERFCLHRVGQLDWNVGAELRLSGFLGEKAAFERSIVERAAHRPD